MKAFAQRVRKLTSKPLFAGILTAVAIGGVAGAVTDTAFVYTSPQNGYYTVNGLDFSPSDYAAAAAMFKAGYYEGGYITMLAADRRCYNSGVHLPNGATIASLFATYSSSTQDNPVLVFSRFPLNNTVQQEIVYASMIDNSGVQKQYVNISIPSTYSLVDNAKFSYGLTICVGQNDKLYNARIGYKYKNAGD